MALANDTRHKIKEELRGKRLFYVCRDAERAEAGLYLGIKNYKIITNRSFFSRQLKKRFPKQIYTLSQKGQVLDTAEILAIPAVKKLIKKNDLVMVFKPTQKIESICKNMNWVLINPQANLANQVEEKLSQLSWLGDLKKYLPETKIDLIKNISYAGKRFIVQFNYAHTGSGTILINSAKDLAVLKKKFPLREARIAQFIEGPIFTLNCSVTSSHIVLGNISYQITGLPPFTDRPFATIGNDWHLPHEILTQKNRSDINNIAIKIGGKLRTNGWRGLYGIDVVMSKKSKKIYLLEINARQPASTSFESYLQISSKMKGDSIFASHLAGLLKINTKGDNVSITDGAQIVQRVTEQISEMPEPKISKPVAWRYVRYNNNKPGSDLMRLQTRNGIMSKHGQLNAHGNELSLFIDFSLRNEIFAQPRAGMVIVRKNKILLIKRKRNNYDYYVMPGGTPEKNESLKKTAQREIAEETGIFCRPDANIEPIIIDGSRNEIYYFANEQGNKSPKLGGPEKIRNNINNSYQLIWLPIINIKKINLLPLELKTALVKKFNKPNF